MAEGSVDEIVREVLRSITPSQEEVEDLLRRYHLVATRLRSCLRDYLPNSCIDISLQGSVAKGTNLRGESDLDVFVLFSRQCVDPERYRELFKDFVERVRECLSDIPSYMEYAEHPYLVLLLDGVEVNIVPALKPMIRGGAIEATTAVDRTPLHTEYVLKKLSPSKRREVLLLKSFLKGLGIYGAELKIKGFSGYLAELLVIHYGTFIDVLKGSLSWKPYRTCIDIEGFYGSEHRCLEVFRDSPLVVVDPVDPRRNAAAAVSLKSLSTFIVGAALFLREPSKDFFHCFKRRNAIDGNRAENALRTRGSRAVAIAIAVNPDVPPETLWGQVRRVERLAAKLLRERRYSVIYHDSWSDERSIAVVLLEVGALLSECYEVFRGPPATDVENALRFIDANRGRAVAGPWIDDNGVLHVVRRRKRCLDDELRELVSNTISQILKIGEVVYVGSSLRALEKLIMERSGRLDEFREWLYTFIYRNIFT